MYFPHIPTSTVFDRVTGHDRDLGHVTHCFFLRDPAAPQCEYW